jgi:hypothetical protein
VGGFLIIQFVISFGTRQRCKSLFLLFCDVLTSDKYDSLDFLNVGFLTRGKPILHDNIYTTKNIKLWWQVYYYYFNWINLQKSFIVNTKFWHKALNIFEVKLFMGGFWNSDRQPFCVTKVVGVNSVGSSGSSVSHNGCANITISLKCKLICLTRYKHPLKFCILLSLSHSRHLSKMSFL